MEGVHTRKMGFDILITLDLGMCPETGKPFYYSSEHFEKVYTLPPIEVPEDLRRYLEGRGRHFHAYTDTFNDQLVFETTIERFVEEYPSWEDLMVSDEYREDILDCEWTEEDHNTFLKLLKWCMHQPVCFRISWSY